MLNEIETYFHERNRKFYPIILILDTIQTKYLTHSHILCKDSKFVDLSLDYALEDKVRQLNPEESQIYLIHKDSYGLSSELIEMYKEEADVIVDLTRVNGTSDFCFEMCILSKRLTPDSKLLRNDYYFTIDTQDQLISIDQPVVETKGKKKKKVKVSSSQNLPQSLEQVDDHVPFKISRSEKEQNQKEKVVLSHYEKKQENEELLSGLITIHQKENKSDSDDDDFSSDDEGLDDDLDI